MKQELNKEMTALILLAKVLFALQLIKENVRVKIDMVSHIELVKYDSFILEKIIEVVKNLLLGAFIANLGVIVSDEAKDNRDSLYQALLNGSYFRLTDSELLSLTTNELLDTIVSLFILGEHQKYGALIDLIYIEMGFKQPVQNVEIQEEELTK